MGRGAVDLRRPDEGAVDPHRPDEAACRHRCAGALSRGQRRRSPMPGPTMPSSRRPRPATRPACRSASGLARPPTSVDSVGAIFAAFGGILVDEKEKITVKSDGVRAALDYCKRLYAFLPPDAPSWDDASNNKMFVAGKTAMILNPPSAWAVAVRDAPKIAEQTWHHPMPKGPKGRYASFLQPNLGIWSFSKNKSAGKSLLRHLSTAHRGRGHGGRQQGLRHPALRQVQDLRHLGRDRAAEGHALSLSRSARRPDPGRRRHAERRIASPSRSTTRA